MDWLDARGSNATTVLARPGQARAGRMWRMQGDGACFHGTAALARTAPRQCLVRDAPASPTMTTRRTFLLSQPLRRFPCRRRNAAFCACSIASTRSDAVRASDCASSMLGKYSGMR